MPDNDDLRMNQNETLNCKLALMGVWTEAWCAGCNIYPSSRLVRNAVTHPFWTITCEAEEREFAQRAAIPERAQAIDRAKDAAARTARPAGAHFRPGHAQ